MSHETAQSQFTIDPYQFLRIIPNPDGSIARNEKFCPRTPATPDHPPHDDHILPVLSKDVFINQSNDSWVRLFLPGGRVLAPLDSSSSGKLPLIVYFHGGGFILNTPDMMFFHKFCSDMAIKLQAVVVSVKHRLAPEHRLPAAYDDAMEALHWIKTTQEVWLQKYVDFSKCFLMGNSSGGNVAYHTALHAAAEVDDLQPLLIKGLILHQPFFGGVNRTCSELSLFTNKIFPVCVSDLMWDLSLPIGADRDHEYCNPTVDGGSKLLDHIKSVGWKVLVTGYDGDPLIDRQIELVKIMEKKGIQVMRQFAKGGSHGAEFLDPFKYEEFFGLLKEFLFSSTFS
ncbi:hypothetical protein LWI28_012469 [Acer negundo]|uniref:Alpha/beta hydrolase fold-3 domain-containing protein n=1 Tax=Acer negundo TaxID=4023 RepID=A0AAD5IEN2_ACENE|nr:hypothetical protein LWI28_012469 [Acer negundo]